MVVGCGIIMVWYGMVWYGMVQYYNIYENDNEYIYILLVLYILDLQQEVRSIYIPYGGLL